MTTTTDPNLRHEDFCTPRPGEDAVRIERYRLPTYGPDGINAVGSVAVVRCLECGAATYDGQRRDG